MGSRDGVSKRPTIYDVAERAGVSISTVSFALNRPERVSENSRRRVLEAADALGFVPRAEAVSRARRTAGRIGVVAPFMAYPTYMRRLAGILGEATPQGLDVCLFDEEPETTVPSPLLSSLAISDRLDGLIVMGRSLDDKVSARLVAQSIPVVVVDATSRVFSTVESADAAAAVIAADYLLSKGHTRIAFMTEPVATPESQRRKLGGHIQLEAFRQTLAAAGHDHADLSVYEVPPSIDEARASVRDHLTSGASRPSALFGHDTLAIGALLAARDLGLGVPSDIGVMGYDDGDAAIAADLTTIRQPFEESGRMAMRTLGLHMKDRSYGRHSVVLDLRLVERATA